MSRRVKVRHAGSRTTEMSDRVLSEHLEAERRRERLAEEFDVDRALEQLGRLPGWRVTRR